MNSQEISFGEIPGGEEKVEGKVPPSQQESSGSLLSGSPAAGSWRIPAWQEYQAPLNFCNVSTLHNVTRIVCTNITDDKYSSID